MSSLSLRTLLTAAVICAASPVAAFAAEPASQPPTFQEKTSEALTKLQPLLDAKQWDQAIKLLEDAEVGTAADSYDRFFLTDIDGKIKLEYKSDVLTAIQLFKTYIDIGQAHPNYLKNNELTDHISYIAHGYYQLAAAVKNNKPLQKEYSEQAITWLKRYLGMTKKPTPEDQYLYAVLLYQEATEGSKVDKDKMQEALDATKKAINSEMHPKPENYQLLIAEYIALDDFKTAGDYFELMVMKKPTSKDAWGQLFGIYNNLAATSEKDPKQQRVYWARAINTIERAQALGFLKEKRDNYNLVTLYYQVQQYGKAVELLQAGLRDKTIEDKPDNWISLAYFYSQIGKDIEAINALKEATRHFPDDSDLYFQVAQDYSANYDTQQTYNWYKQAVDHHHFHQQKEYMAEYYYAFAAFELQKYDEALDAVHAALKLKGAPRKELEGFEKGIDDAIKQREINRKAPSGGTN